MTQILVVDDEAGVRSFLVGALTSEDVVVDEASDGATALKRLSARSYQVMLTDLRMPGMDGMTLLKRVREEHPAVEVIVLTAFGSVETAVEAMKLGAFDYLQKPLSGPVELRHLVHRAIERYQLHARREAAQRGDEWTLSYGAAAMESIERALKKVASTGATVLITGENGTGKEIAARLVHRWSQRADGPFVAVNCSALAENLLESELFGHEKGAFTGASTRRRGRIELADGGTFFLDEIGELKPSLQVKLLRVLQERRFERVGGNQTVDCNVRWIAATNRDLDAMVREGAFREDLFHRIAVFPVRIPPLRERRDDIPPLAEALLQRIRVELGRPSIQIHASALSALQKHTWPGNVRQLANALERAAILSDGDELRAENLDLHLEGSATVETELPTMAEAERAVIQRALDHFGGNRRRVADHLGIGLRTLYEKLKRYGLA